MNSNFLSTLWAEALKAYRSKMLLVTFIFMSIFSGVDGLFMLIMKNPEKARDLGLIGAKAQMVAGTADWPTFFYVLVIGMAMAGAILFAFITAWVFGREFSDHTVKELLALPTPRWSIITAKFVLMAVWVLGLTLWTYVLALAIGHLVDIPGWSPDLAQTSFGYVMLAATLTFLLMPVVALFASAGRGFLPPLGWAVATLAMAEIAMVLGWGDWFPWAVPALVGEMAGPKATTIEIHSYLTVLVVFLAGLAVTFTWWQTADQAR